jgi:hypothetical protein
VGVFRHSFAHPSAVLFPSLCWQMVLGIQPGASQCAGPVLYHWTVGMPCAVSPALIM